MEGLVIFVVIIIAFNLLNAILRAARGGKAAQLVKRSAQAVGEPTGSGGFDSEIEDHTRMERVAHFPAAGRKRLIDPFDFAAETEDTAYRDTPAPTFEKEATQKESAETIVERSLRRAASHPVAAADAVMREQRAGLRDIFSERDALLDAFIFHEIMDKPVSMRRRR